MIRESLIRRLPEFAFALLFGGGVVLGGDAALAGLPKVLDALAPRMAAQASVSHADGVAHVSLSQGFAESLFAPQVLTPVTAAPRPAWLTEAVRENPPPALRDIVPSMRVQSRLPASTAARISGKVT